jgi:hypothetical protein
MLALQMWNPEFKLSPAKKKKKLNEYSSFGV